MTSITERVKSVPVECYGILLSDIHPDDRGIEDMEKRRCRLIVVELNEPGYRLATLNDKVDDLYANQETLDRLNKEVYKVKPDWAQEIADSSLRASSQRGQHNSAVEAAQAMWLMLRRIADETLVGDLEDEVNDMLTDYEDFAPEEDEEEE